MTWTEIRSERIIWRAFWAVDLHIKTNSILFLFLWHESGGLTYTHAIHSGSDRHRPYFGDWWGADWRGGLALQVTWTRCWWRVSEQQNSRVPTQYDINCLPSVWHGTSQTNITIWQRSNITIPVSSTINIYLLVCKLFPRLLLGSAEKCYFYYFYKLFFI
jgi:hypothetical protein